VLKSGRSKTLFMPTDAVWATFRKAHSVAWARFFNDKAYVKAWLDSVLIYGAVGNGGGQRVFPVGRRFIVDLDLYRINGPAASGQLSGVTSDWDCTEAKRRDYVYDTDTVYLPLAKSCFTPAPWDPR